MSLWQDIQPWIDPSTGLMTATDGGKDNLVLMSAYLLRELRANGEDAAASILASNIQRFLSACRVDTGLYSRAPGDTSPNSLDNLIGICSVSTFNAECIRHRWNWHLSCFDVTAPNKFALNQNFFGRFIGVKAFIVEASMNSSWLVQRLLWCLATLWSVKTSSGASNPLLTMLQCDIMAGKCPRTVKYWRKHYTAKSLYSQYFGANHPLTLYAKDFS